MKANTMPVQSATSMDKNARGKILSMQHHEIPNMSLGIPLKPQLKNEEDDLSDTDDEELPRGHKPDAYSTKELCRSLIGTPTWDGQPLTWKAFMKEWKAYWEFQKGLVGPKAKKWIFIKSLPEKWQTHMKANITDADWTYKAIVEFLNYQNDIMVPDWKKESQWRQCVPKGNTYMDFVHWWMTWRRLGAECDLRNVDWNHQFNACMNHNNLFSTYLQEIVENEIVENTTWDIERRYTFIANKLMIAFKAQETLKAGNSQESSSRTLVCYKCGKKGHTQAQCWSNHANVHTPGSPGHAGNHGTKPAHYGASRTSTCFSCGQQGHFATHCPQKLQAHVPEDHGPRSAAPPSSHAKVGGGYPKPWMKGRGKSTWRPPTSGFGGRGYHENGYSQPHVQAKPHFAVEPENLSREELQRRRAHGLCVYCGEAGHYSGRCPIKRAQADRQHVPQRHVAAPRGSKGMDAKGSKGMNAKGSKGSKGKGKGKPSGKAKGSNSLRELDAHDHGDPAHEYYDEVYQEHYDDYWHEESWERQHPQEGRPAPSEA